MQRFFPNDEHEDEENIPYRDPDDEDDDEDEEEILAAMDLAESNLDQQILETALKIASASLFWRLTTVKYRLRTVRRVYRGLTKILFE